MTCLSAMGAAANISLLIRRNLLDTRARGPRCPGQTLDERSKLEQVVDTKPGSSSGTLAEQVRVGETRPRGQHRAQSPLRIEEHDPILAPVPLAGDEHQLAPALRMERVCDRKGYRRLMNRMSDSC